MTAAWLFKTSKVIQIVEYITKEMIISLKYLLVMQFNSQLNIMVVSLNLEET